MIKERLFFGRLQSRTLSQEKKILKNSLIHKKLQNLFLTKKKDY